MSMRNLGWMALALTVSASFGSFARADQYGFGQQTLDQMGLSGLHVMSDVEALAIRGYGAGAYGFSFATVASKNGSAGSVNGYNAKGSTFAAGENYSEATIEIRKSGGHGGGYSDKGGKGKSLGAFAGGGSIAKTK